MKNNSKRLLAFLGAVALSLSLFSGVGPTETVMASETNMPVYRVYNPNTGEHLYTISTAERDNLKNHGWNYEGIGWYTSQAGTGAPVYRVYNPNAKGGDHYYTMNKYEATELVRIGWKWDNNGAPVFYSYGSENLYIEYNPNAESGSHNYTTSKGEHDYLLKIGWKYGAVAWNVMTKPMTYTCSVKVDENITGTGGEEKAINGSYRLMYSDLPFDASATNETPELEFSADVTMTGTSNDYEVQFIVAGTGPRDGQVGVELHYQGGSDARYCQGKINSTSINFPANSNSYGQQYYSVNTSCPFVGSGEKAELRIKYFASGYFESYVKGQLVGRYKTSIIPASSTSVDTQQYILHFNANTKCQVSNIKVVKKGVDVTHRDAYTSFKYDSYDISDGKPVAAAY